MNNSAQHQSIDQLGEGPLINWQAEDGTVEGIEWKAKSGKPFMLAIEWHPERMCRFKLEDSAMSRKIKDRFMEEIKKRGK